MISVSVRASDPRLLTRLGMLNMITKEVDKAVENALDELEGTITARLDNELTSFGLGGSSIANSVEVDRSKGVLEINVTSDHAMYVEFGTGVVGEESPHPNTEFNGNSWFKGYDINGHGEDGWDYIKGGKKYHTTGQPARPFMYNTWRYARLRTTKVFKKHFERMKV